MPGAQLGSTTTDAGGRFSVPIGTYTGPVMLQLSGGSYVDEATGTTMSMAAGDVMTAILPLVWRHEVPAWAGILILGREFLINGLRMIAVAERKIIAAGPWGKVKTVVYIVALSVIIGAPMIPAWERPLRLLGQAGLVLGMVLAAVSAIEYFRWFTPTDRPSDPA